jgi:two-component system, NtrC family, sensor kinase
MKNTHELLLKTAMYFLLFIYSAKTFGQNKSIDSLKRVLQTQKEDTNKVNTLNALCDKLLYISVLDSGNNKEAMQWAEQALALSEDLHFLKGKGNAIESIGRIYISRKNLNEAHKDFDLALKCFTDCNDKYGAVGVLSQIENVYESEDNDGKALDAMYLELRLDDELKDSLEMATCYTSIAEINSHEKDFPEALKNLSSTLRIAEKIHNEELIAEANFLLGQIYSNLKNYVEALIKDSAALIEYKALKVVYAPYNIGAILANDGDIYESQGMDTLASGDKDAAKNKFRESLEKYLSALKLFEGLGNPFFLATLYEHLGKIYIRLNDFTKARSYFAKSLAFFNRNRDLHELENIYAGLTELDSANGNLAQAYKDYKLQIAYRDSTSIEATARKSQQLKMQYEFDKKDAVAKIEQEKKDAATKRAKNIQYFAIGALGIIALAVMIIALIQYRNNKQKKKANLLLQQQKEKVETTLSELQSTQAQLIQSEKMASLGELTAGIAHEIQNPLNFVNNFSEVNHELIEEAGQEMDKGNLTEARTILFNIKENEEKINHHGKRADAIVKGMLRHSRSGTGHKEPTDINALADEYLRLSYHGLRAKDKSFNTEMKTEFDNSIGKINIIPQDIGRVLLNLYNNAFYTIGERSKTENVGFEPMVSVSTKKIGNKVYISVGDNGNGIPKKVVDKIFQPFFTTKPTGQGTGLGLSLSYDIIKAHGGEIKVETKEGKGSEFIIQLPINQTRS